MTKYAKVSILKGQLNIRLSPMGEIIGTLKNKEIVEILSSRDHVTGKWFKVKTIKGLTGFCLGALLEEMRLKEQE